jgi:catechol 2,3-dioxygenase-like lactoylglutathione lyase family enzyme
MSARFHHPGLVVPDLEKACTFYKDLLEIEEVSRFSWDPSNGDVADAVINLKNSAAEAIMLRGANFNLELFQYSSPQQHGNPAKMNPCDPGIRHIAFEFDDIFAACDRFKKGGGSLHNDPVDLGGTYAIYGRDPFGNVIELMQPITKD